MKVRGRQVPMFLFTLLCRRGRRTCPKCEILSLESHLQCAEGERSSLNRVERRIRERSSIVHRAKFEKMGGGATSVCLSVVWIRRKSGEDISQRLRMENVRIFSRTRRKRGVKRKRVLEQELGCLLTPRWHRSSFGLIDQENQRICSTSEQ